MQRGMEKNRGEVHCVFQRHKQELLHCNPTNTEPDPVHHHSTIRGKKHKMSRKIILFDTIYQFQSFRRFHNKSTESTEHCPVMVVVLLQQSPLLSHRAVPSDKTRCSSGLRDGLGSSLAQSVPEFKEQTGNGKH